MRRRLRQRPLTLTSRFAMRRRSLSWPMRLLLAALVLAAAFAAAHWGRQAWEQYQAMQRELEQLQWQVQAQQTQEALARELAAAPEQVSKEAAIESLSAQVRSLQAENARLKEDLGFYENLLPASDNGEMSIRNMVVAREGEEQLAWQMLLMRPRRDAGEFKGELEWRVRGQLAGKAWNAPPLRQSLTLGRYLRLEGQLKIPKGLSAVQVTALVFEGKQERARHALTLEQDAARD